MKQFRLRSLSVFRRHVTSDVRVNTQQSSARILRQCDHLSLIPSPTFHFSDRAYSSASTLCRSSCNVDARLELDYGLHLHEYPSVISKNEISSSRNDDNGDRQLWITVMKKMENWRQQFLKDKEKHNGDNDSDDGDRGQKLKLYETNLSQMIQHLNEMKTSLDQIYDMDMKQKRKREEDNEKSENSKNSIVQFRFEYRSLLLTLNSMMDHVFMVKSVRHMSRDELDQQNRMIQVLETLCLMGVILVRDKIQLLKSFHRNNDDESGNDDERLSNVDTRLLYYPFFDQLNMNNFEQLTKMDVKDFLQHIGKQYAPMLKLFYGLMVTVTASYNASLVYDEATWRTPMFFASNLFYLINSKKAAHEAFDFFSRNISITNGQGLWTMQDRNPIVKTFSFLALPAIEISGLFPIELQLPDKYDEQRVPTVRKQVKSNEKEQVERTRNELDIESIGVASMDEFEFYCGQVHDILCSTTETLPSTVNLRFISSKPLPNIPKNPTGEPSVSLLSDYPLMSNILRQVYKYGSKVFAKSDDSDRPSRKGLIFHVHGGGFMAMSSFSHECYLRPWAKQTGLPIISVDYTKTPNRQYPVQVEECYQAYKWVLDNAEKSLGVNLDKIIFAGDSAGGNLVLAVLLRAIHDGIRIPDGVALSYPATYLHMAPSSSRIMSLLDPLLNYKLLELCGLEYYMNARNVHIQNNGLRNPLISPAVAPNEVLQKFPKMYIHAGTLDPLFDDSAYLAKRIEQVNGRESIKFDVYDSLGHGYLNLIDFVPESRLASSRLCDWIVNIVDKHPK